MIIVGQNMDYQSFDNTILSPEANSVRFFLQDEQGLIWIGTNQGLYSYDGYKSYNHYTPGSFENRMINCGLFYQDDFLLLGTDKGILKYNYKFDRYEPFEIEISKDIRSLIRTTNDLWLGCADGLYRYNFLSKEIIEIFDNTDEIKNTGIIYTLLEDNGYIYVEAGGFMGRVSIDNNKYKQIDDIKSDGWFVEALLKDETRGCIWIGGGTKLTKFTPSANSFETVSDFPVIKSMELDCNNNLLLGTDNGLYTYNEKETKHFVHNTQKSNSLSNNIVWTVFRDKSDNVWLGTDFGISMAPFHRRFDFIPVFQFSGTGEGNQFYSIFKDSRGFYWLGGDNGLIRTTNLTGVNKEIRWYKMGEKEFYIPHSHIRDIFEDSERNLWIATDFGISRYNYHNEKFTTYIVSNKDTSSRANWAYDIMEDHSGNLWISSFNDGIFKISKNKLFGERFINVADTHYSVNNGLTSNNIDQIIFDKAGKIWALNQNNGLDLIDVSTGKVSKFPIFEYTDGNNPKCMISDSDGNLWVGFRNGLVRINPIDEHIDKIDFEDTDNALVSSLVEVGNNIWATTFEGLWVINKDDFSIQHIGLADKFFYSSYYDAHLDKLLLGGADGIAMYSPVINEEQNQINEIIISTILINGKKYVNDNDELAVRYNNEIELPHNQNNITIEFSDFQYSKENRGINYIYKLDDEDDNWSTLNANDNTIHLSKLSPGTYNLYIAKRESKKAPAEVLSSMQLIINPPWYGTQMANILYALALVAFLFWSIKLFNQKNRLKFARIEKEKTIEQTKMKMEFFTNIAHELKTPLTLIIAPLSGLIHEVKNGKVKDALEMIHQNAMKLNSLVHQTIDYYRDDSKVPVGILFSRVEFVEFARSIYSSFEENMKDRQITFIFNTSSEKIFVDIDIVKVESILNNLLSNACKYTNEGDTIIMSLKYSTKDNNLEILVSDTGIGIPEKDLPYIFQRFFQSPSNGGREGSGIGLYLVKNFTELHGGSVSVESNLEEGTTFIVKIPAIMNSMVEPLSSAENNNIKSKEKPLIVIVEDNIAIANFIYNIFSHEFRIVIVHNGKMGLKICTDLKPDIIISDIIMPVMDGLEMCQRLKKNIPTSTIPIVLLTAKDDRETELNSINLKIDAFIAKPFDSNILYSRVKQLIEAKNQMGKKIWIQKLSTPVVEKVASEDEKFLAQITKIIEEQIANPDLNVNFLCKKVNVPQKQMYRKIKYLTGLTAVDYIKSIRMKKAAMLLSNKNFTVAEVMYKVGYSNHSYFAKCFSSKFGKTPRQFVEH